MTKNEIICFKGNTLVGTPNGPVKINNINLGDVVYSYDLELNSLEKAIVRKIANSYHNKIVKVIFNDKSFLEMTIDHPVWVVGKGWSAIESNEFYKLKLKTLSIGDKCISINNNIICLKEIIDIQCLFGDFKMFIISGGIHNIIMANDILVHDENLVKLELIEEGIIYNEI